MGRHNGLQAATPPWWGAALIGVAITIIFVFVTTVPTGTQNLPHYGWYTDATGHLTTGLILDETQYLRLVDHSTGDAPSSLIAPFTARALAPWLAGHLPFDAATSLLVINITSLTVGTFALALLATDLTRSRRATLAAVLVWSISLPTLRYTSGSFVDPAAVGLVPAVLLLLYRRLMIPAALVFTAAVWMKETALSILPLILTFEWMRHEITRRRRLVNCALWTVVAAAAYSSAELFGGGHLIVFASWIPASVSVAKRMFLFNVLSISRTAAFVLTVLPAAFGVAMWLRHRRRAEVPLPDHVAMPLVVGCGSATALSLYAIPSAVLGGRTVWMTLAPAALLIAGWVAQGDRTTDRADLVAFTRGAIAVGVIVGVALVPLSVWSTRSLHSVPDVLDRRYQPRFTMVPEQPEQLFVHHASGHGPGVVEVADTGPVLVEFDSTEPLVISRDGEPLIGTGRALRGVTMSDPLDGTDLGIETTGDWNIIIRPISSAMFWESISQVEGTGPNVVIFPGGTPRAFTLNWTSDDASDRIELVGGCRLGTCGELPHDSVVPAGTEALVISASGDWHLFPDSYDPDNGPQPVLAGTVITDS